MTHMQELGSIAHSQSARSAGLQTEATVFVVDGDSSARENLQSLICEPGWRVVSFCSAEDFLARPKTMMPSCLLVDVALPQLDGLALQEMIADRPEVPVIFVTSEGDVRKTVRAMKAGAVDFLMKPLNREAILCAVRCALGRSRQVLKEEESFRALKSRYDSLTVRERQVLVLVVSGLLNKQAAAQLEISEITVKAHRGKVMRKMDANSLAHLVTMASELQIRPYLAAAVNRPSTFLSRSRAMPSAAAEP
jgi:FixJ family two-component response regulator